MNKSTIALLLALVTASALSAQNLIVNGSFEDGPEHAPTFNNIGTPSGDSIDVSGTGGLGEFTTGWTAFVPSGHAVTFAKLNGGGAFPSAVDGFQNYNVGGFNNEKGFGMIFQDFSTSIGQQYQLSYFVAGNTNEIDNVMALTQVYNVVSGATNGDALGFENVVTNSDMMSPHGFLFTAVGTTTRLMFTDAQTNLSTNNQLNIDAVSVSAIPEPSTYAAMAGAAMLGLAVWRRRRVAPVVPIAA